MNPEPAAAPVQSVFPVPANITAVTLAGGCGETHYPQNGAVDCAACAAVVKPYSFPAAPESASTPEQPSQASAGAPSAPSPEVATPTPEVLPGPPSVDAPAPKSKKSDAAPSA